MYIHIKSVKRRDMTARTQGLGWQDVHDEALRRIQAREWAPGALIPGEEDLASELGCARATVNRALRELAAAGLLERRRRAGTRVAELPNRRAHLSISLIAEQIEARGARPGYALIACDAAPIPVAQRHALGLGPDVATIRVEALHLADGRPYVHENRWINLAAMPTARSTDFSGISANEWLLRNAPFAHGTLDYTADAAGEMAAPHLGCTAQTPAMVLERATFGPAHPITWVRLTYAPGYRLHMDI
jgi:GntR family histidine utilization transcriptional repressor